MDTRRLSEDRQILLWSGIIENCQTPSRCLTILLEASVLLLRNQKNAEVGE